MSTLVTEAATPAASPKPAERRLLVKILKSPVAAVSLVVLIILAIVTLFADFFAPHDANVGDISNAFASPSAQHLLGTDSAGRDILSRIIAGSQVTLGGAALALAVALLIGVTLGLISGYYGRGFDLGAEWGNNLLMALPTIMVLLAVRASFGNSVWISMSVLGVLLAPGFYRLTRSIVMGVRNELYVDAARVSGLTDARIMSRHVLSAVRAPIIIHACLTGVTALGTQSGLEFIGLADTSVPAWGTMLNEALVNLYIAPGLMLWPGIALGIVNAALILFGNGLRDALEDRPSIRTKRTKTEFVASFDDPKDPFAPLPTTTSTPQDALLSVENLTIGYPAAEDYKLVVRNVSLGVRAGEVLGIVGESGSGKTQTAWALLNLLPREAKILSGEFKFDGQTYRSGSRAARQALLGLGIGYIPQEPMSNLDPSFTVGYQLTEPMKKLLGLSSREAKERSLALLSRVGIVDPQRTFAAYPHEISGGMAQRVLIAGAVSCNPKVLIADEPTTALDVTVQAEVLDLIRDLQREMDMAVIMVTHNFGVVADICDTVAVMRLGQIVEQAPVRDLFANPQHPYTQMLLGAVLEGKEPRTYLLPSEPKDRE